MKKIPALYITKWVEFKTDVSGKISHHNVIFTVDNNLGEYNKDNELFYASWVRFPFNMSFEKLARNQSFVMSVFVSKVEPFNVLLERNAHALNTRLYFNEESRTEATICFGGIDKNANRFKKTVDVRLKAGISPEEKFFFTSMFAQLENVK